jgi:excisionase family DNA binding protein
MRNTSTSVVAPAPTRHLLTIKEGCAYIGVSERFVRELLAQRQLPAVRLGRSVKLRQTDLDAYIEASTQPALRGPLAS